MTYSPDSVGMHRHTFTGRPAFTGQPRSKTPPDFRMDNIRLFYQFK